MKKLFFGLFFWLFGFAGVFAQLPTPAPVAPTANRTLASSDIGTAIPVSFAPLITAVGTGTSTSLEAMPTAGLALPVLRTLAVGGGLQDWLLAVGTDSNDSLHQRPNDYNATTNAVVWVRKR